MATCFAGLLSLQAQDITGSWNGLLDIQGTQLRLVMHISETNGTYHTTLDSPDQGATDIPTDKTTFVDGQLQVEALALAMVFTGQLQEDGSIEGTFAQGGFELPLVLGREEIEKPLAEVRPQDPTDFPYQQETVSFENIKVEAVTLAGTLTLPEGELPKAIVVLVSGSGPQDRNEEIGPFNHRPFLVLSDYLTRQGIGVLRYDDRGVAESTGDHGSATTADFASDASAAIDYLAGREDLAGVQLGIAGHSEGGMIAPMVARENEEVDFIALLAGPGTPIDELMLEQSRLISEASGVPEEVARLNRQFLGEAYAYLKAEKEQPTEEVRNGVIRILRDGIEEFPEDMKADLGDLDEFASSEAEGLLTPWFRYFITFQPATVLKEVQCPVLAINGSLDLQVPAKANLEAIENALQAGGNTNFEIFEMPGLNHLFQQATTGAVAEYGEIEETFNLAAMERIATWIHTQSE